MNPVTVIGFPQANAPIGQSAARRRCLPREPDNDSDQRSEARAASTRHRGEKSRQATNSWSPLLLRACIPTGYAQRRNSAGVSPPSCFLILLVQRFVAISNASRQSRGNFSTELWETSARTVGIYAASHAQTLARSDAQVMCLGSEPRPLVGIGRGARRAGPGVPALFAKLCGQSPTRPAPRRHGQWHGLGDNEWRTRRAWRIARALARDILRDTGTRRIAPHEFSALVRALW